MGAAVAVETQKHQEVLLVPEEYLFMILFRMLLITKTSI